MICRSTNFFTDDGFELYEDDDDDDYYHSQYSRAEQHRAEQQWQRDRRAERMARRREKVRIHTENVHGDLMASLRSRSQLTLCL